ncbi:CvpA family protein [Fontisphaera persica]|uniref:CvpA family protein n=1 Tax=Fontisphaera persica TaxID=2974023 RepID=UPI0024C042AA|nr:CvpA family protein [Fontisphaera persica]WCJ58914.1 CvpA family protein [Fontisphaera persica]
MMLLAAAGGSASPSTEMSGAWFDVLTVVVLGWGIFRGRKRGMSEELLSLFQILTILVVCGMYHRPVGNWFAQTAGVTHLFAYMFVYVAMLIIILSLFTATRRAVGEKLVSSDLFGRMEYILGMLAGMIRYAGYLVVALALLNAPVYTREEIQAQVDAQLRNLGSHFFPTPGQLQESIFKKSFCGQWVRRNLELLLIRPTPTTDAVSNGGKRPTLKELKEQELKKATEK